MKRILLLLPLLLMVLTACNNTTNPEQNNTPTTETPKQRDNCRAADYSIDTGKPVIHAEIQGNNVVLTFDKDELNVVGIEGENGYVLSEGPVNVGNIKGTPQSVFISDIGQDFCPILCVLFENGDVQILSLSNSIACGDFEASEVLYHDVFGFKEGGGGAFEDEFGNIGFDYATIFAVTANGEEEIELNPFNMRLMHYDHANGGEFPTALYTLSITYDWKMDFVVEKLQEESVIEKKGHVWAIDLDFDKMVYRFGYEMTKLIDGSDLSDDPKVSSISEKGVFESRYNEQGKHVITPIEGLDLTGQGLNHPVEFEYKNQ